MLGKQDESDLSRLTPEMAETHGAVLLKNGQPEAALPLLNAAIAGILIDD